MPQLKHILGVLSAIPVIYIAAATLGADLPIPAWSKDIIAIQLRVDTNTRSIIYQGMQANQGLIFQNLREQKKYIMGGVAVPNALLREAIYLDGVDQDYKDQLKKLGHK